MSISPTDNIFSQLRKIVLYNSTTTTTATTTTTTTTATTTTTTTTATTTTTTTTKTTTTTQATCVNFCNTTNLDPTTTCVQNCTLSVNGYYGIDASGDSIGHAYCVGGTYCNGASDYGGTAYVDNPPNYNGVDGYDHGSYSSSVVSLDVTCDVKPCYLGCCVHDYDDGTFTNRSAGYYYDCFAPCSCK